VPCPVPRRPEWVHMSIASPSTLRVPVDREHRFRLIVNIQSS
jgi:hypothetical protein